MSDENKNTPTSSDEETEQNPENTNGTSSEEEEIIGPTSMEEFAELLSLFSSPSSDDDSEDSCSMSMFQQLANLASEIAAGSAGKSPSEEGSYTLFDSIVKQAVGCDTGSVFVRRNLMRDARAGDEYMEQDALNTGLSLCSIADAMFTKENYQDSLIRYVRSAIRYDIPAAQWRIGMCLYHGFYIDKDIEEAKKWFVESAEHSYQHAMDALEKYYSDSPVQESAEDAKATFMQIIGEELNEW